jgi:hypothetical protein
MRIWWVRRTVKGILFLVVGLLVFGLIVMTIWNAIIPEVFKGPVLGFWQAVGLLLLSHLLLRGWAPWRYGNGWRRDRWRRRFEEKLASMTPEEREKFKEEWKGRCGYSGEKESTEQGREKK